MPYTELQTYLNDYDFINNFNSHQLGSQILQGCNEKNIQSANIIIVGCGKMLNKDVDTIREHFYKMYYWHQPLLIADIGNIVPSANTSETMAALSFVLTFLLQQHKTVIILGGSHQYTVCQYNAFKNNNEIINASVVDIKIDLDENEKISSDNFLYTMLTETPNFIKQFNLMGFQSFYTNPKMVETLDKLHFDCHRLGKVREDLNEMEPVLRYTDLFSFDLSAVRHADAPCGTTISPNGLHGDEACQLARYAGMSDKCCSIGLYGYNPEDDENEMSAMLLAQMVWYFIDGVYYKQHEAEFSNKNMFNEYHVNMDRQQVLFIKSKRTLRWWMQLPNKKFIPCTYQDYTIAVNNDIPERWLREMERSI